MTLNKNIKYIDAETCNFGDPAFDVVYFCNHLLLKSIHIPDKKNKFIDMDVGLNSSYNFLTKP